MTLVEWWWNLIIICWHFPFFLYVCMLSLCTFCKMLTRYGSWAVCYTYGTWFGVKGLVAAGRNFSNCSSIRKACNFLLSKQLASGGWGESYLSCQDKVKFGIQLIIFMFNWTLVPKFHVFYTGVYQSWGKSVSCGKYRVGYASSHWGWTGMSLNSLPILLF